GSLVVIRLLRRASPASRAPHLPQPIQNGAMDERVEVDDRARSRYVAAVALLGEAPSDRTRDVMADLASLVARDVHRRVPHGAFERIEIDASKLGVGRWRRLHRVVGSVRDLS